MSFRSSKEQFGDVLKQRHKSVFMKSCFIMFSRILTINYTLYSFLFSWIFGNLCMYIPLNTELDVFYHLLSLLRFKMSHFPWDFFPLSHTELTRSLPSSVPSAVSCSHSVGQNQQTKNRQSQNNRVVLVSLTVVACQLFFFIAHETKNCALLKIWAYSGLMECLFSFATPQICAYVKRKYNSPHVFANGLRMLKKTCSN